MGIAMSVASWLNSLGHNAIHLNEEGLHQLQDNLIISKALTENRIIITADMDFGHLLALNKSDLVSVIAIQNI
jgi:predicted nuclease of predicted toxin-antitoxin system